MMKLSKFAWFSIATPCLFLLLSLIITIHAIIATNSNWNIYQHKKTTSFLTIISMILFTLCMICCVSHVFNPFAKDPESHRNISGYIAYLAFNLGKITMYLLFLSLLHYSFYNTRYDYNKWIKIIYIFFAAIVPIFSMILDTLETFILPYTETWHLIKRFTEHSNSILLSLFVTILFIRSLYRVAWKQLKHSSDSNDNEAIQKATKWMDTFTKYTILLVVIVIFGLIVLTMVVLTAHDITFGIKHESWFLMLWIIYYIDCFVNVLCIYLRFNFASNIYYKLCGYCCHDCCRNYVVSSIKYKKQQYKNSITQNTELPQKTHKMNIENKEFDISMMQKKEETELIEPPKLSEYGNNSNTKTIFTMNTTHRTNNSQSSIPEITPSKIPTQHSHNGSDTEMHQIGIIENVNDSNDDQKQCCLILWFCNK